MKKYVIASIFSVLVVYALHSVCVFNSFLIFIRTSAPKNTEVSFEYTTLNGSFTKTAKTNENHQAFLELNVKKIKAFRVSSKENVKIQSIYVHGKNGYEFSVQNGMWKEEILKAKQKIDFYNIFFIFFLSFYTIVFFLNRSAPLMKNKVKAHISERNHNIDFLRVVFTLLIILYHIDNRLKIWSNLGLGVEFFFILSGYFLSSISIKTDDVHSFIKKKIIRFFPLILFSEMLSIIAIERINISSFVAEILFLPRTGLYQAMGYNGATWYINVLFWVSLAFYYLLKTKSRETVNLIIGFITFFATIICVNKNFALNDTDKSVLNTLLPISMMKGCCGMGIGYFLAEFLRGKGIKPSVSKKEKLFWTVLETTILGYGITMMLFKPLVPSNNILCLIVFAVLIALFLEKRGAVSQLADKPFFSKCSQYCLAFYVTHYVVLTFWLFPIRDRNPEWFFSHKAIVASVLGVLITIVGVFSHHLVEKPAAMYLKKILFDKQSVEGQ